MGAFGAALIARDRYEEGDQTTMLSKEAMEALTYETKMARCKGCTNNCLLTINVSQAEDSSSRVTVVNAVLV